MNKTQLVDFVSEKAELPKATASRVVEAVLDGIMTTLGTGDPVSLLNFGTFVVSERAARDGRNPLTGETIKIKKSKSVRFKPGKALKEAVKL